MASIQRGFQSHDRNHIAKPPFEVNWDSPQARGLKLWVPAHGSETRDLVGRKPVTMNASTLFVPNEHGRLVWESSSTEDLATLAGTADGDLDFGLANPFTLSCWANMLSGDTGTFISKSGALNTARQYQLGNAAAQTFIRFHGLEFLSGVDIAAAGPTLVTVTKSGAEATNDARFYHDGVFIAEATAGTDVTNNADVQIGARRGDDTNGSVTPNAFPLASGSSVWDLRIYDVALTDAEIAHIFAHPSDLALETGRRTNFFVPAVAGPLVGGGRLKTLVGGGLV